MLFVREKIPLKLLRRYKSNSSVENIFIEINLQLKKWLLPCSYNPISEFCVTYSLKDLIKEPTCFTSLENTLSS